MKKRISEKHEYPNMTPNEIISLGYELSGGALEKFAKSVVIESSEMVSGIYQDKIDEAENYIAEMQKDLFQ